jgi:hypothetical protein
MVRSPKCPPPVSTQCAILSYAVLMYNLPRGYPGSLWGLRATHFKYAQEIDTDLGSAVIPDGGGEWNWLGWVRVAFLGVRGGTLLKVVALPQQDATASQVNMWCKANLVESNILLNGFLQTVHAQGPGGPPGGTMQVGPTGAFSGSVEYMNADKPACEWFFPYTHWKKFENACAATLNGSGGTQLYAVLTFKTVSNTFMEIHQAGAADINFIHFRHTPTIRKPSFGGGVVAMAPEGGDFEVSPPFSSDVL